MKLAKFAVPALILYTGVILISGVSFGKAEYTKKEKKACVTCHVAANSKELNDTGKYYKEKKTLEGAPAAKK
jgi:hypothetical protein